MNQLTVIGKNWLGLFILLMVCIGSTAQINPAEIERKNKKEKQAEKMRQLDKMIQKEEEGALIYHKQNLFGVKLNSDGWNLLYEKGYMKTVNRSNLFSIEFGERKDRKEKKIPLVTQSGIPLGNSLIYGKQNNFFFLKLGVGQSHLLGGKGNRNGVAVSAIYAGGITLGLLKPYYLNASDHLNGQTVTIKWKNNNSYTDSLFINPESIIGGSGIFKGVKETKIKPGIHLKGAVRFDYGRYNELISAIETGINTEFYFSKMPIMVKNPEKRLFINVFVAIEFGKRK